LSRFLCVGFGFSHFWKTGQNSIPDPDPSARRTSARRNCFLKNTGNGNNVKTQEVGVWDAFWLTCVSHSDFPSSGTPTGQTSVLDPKL
jgi:hypothetical protein